MISLERNYYKREYSRMFDSEGRIVLMLEALFGLDSFDYFNSFRFNSEPNEFSTSCWRILNSLRFIEALES